MSKPQGGIGKTYIRMSAETKKQLTATVYKTVNKAHAAMTNELLAIAYLIMEESKDEVPVETGSLLDSAIVLDGKGRQVRTNTHLDPAIYSESRGMGTQTSIKIGYNVNMDAIQRPRLYSTKEGLKMRKDIGKVKAYAKRVHEDLHMHHEQGKAKFLEDPVNRYRSDMAGRLNRAAAKVAKEISNG
jgi:hypothetical protein